MSISDGELLKLFQTIIDYLPCGVSLADRDLRFTAWNAEFKRLLQFPDDLFEPEAPDLYKLALFNARRGEYGPGQPEEQAAAVVERARKMEPHVFERTRPDGTVLEIRGRPLPGGGFVSIYTDITERKNYQATLERLATTDHLTGLLNRRAFLDATEREIRRAHRYGQSLSLLMLDVDHFKRINDSYGHPAGDEVLRRIAAASRGMLRDEDLIGRLGGEEFAVTLVQAPLAAAIAVAERLRKAIAEVAIEHEGRRLSVTVSIGVAEFGGDTDSLSRLVSMADRHLYNAKHDGRNRVASGLPDPAGAAT